MTGENRSRVLTVLGGLLAGTLLVTFFLSPRDSLFTTDSMEYLARFWTEPWHPHHLVWVPVLGWAREGVQWLMPAVGAVEAAQIFQAIVAASAVILFAAVLKCRGGVSLPLACLGALLLAASRGWRLTAQETEAYNAAVMLFLASVLCAPIPGAERSRNHYSRIAAAALLFSGAVCVHQVFALAGIAIFLYYWRPGDAFGRNALSGIIMACAAGLLTILAYLAAYATLPDKPGFVPWLTLYSGQLPVFGHWSHFSSLYQVNRLVANLLAAVAFDPVPMIKAAATHGLTVPLLGKMSMAVGYLLWATLWAAALGGVFSRHALYRFFGAWYLWFELFQWYWAPWLLQMQTLVLPAAVGGVILGAGALSDRFPAALRAKPWAAASAWLAVMLILGIQVIAPAPLGHVSMREARDFFAKNDTTLRESEPWVMMLYGYGDSYPYAIAANARPHPHAKIFVIENRSPAWVQLRDKNKAVNAGAGAVEAGGAFLVHKSMLLADGGEGEVERILADVQQKNGRGALHSSMLSATDGTTIALELRAPAVAEGSNNRIKDSTLVR